MIRHITAIDNVKDGTVVNPLKTKHGVVKALKISDLSGWIDPVTHLNSHFFSHLINIVYVAEKLEIGAKMVMDGDKFMYAFVDPSTYGHYGEVDVVERSSQMKNAVHGLARNKETSNKAPEV